jgi:hypothetical protein
MLTYRMPLSRVLLILSKMTHIALTEHTNQMMEHNDETSYIREGP